MVFSLSVIAIMLMYVLIVLIFPISLGMISYLIL